MKRVLSTLALVVSSSYCMTAQAVDLGAADYNPAISVVLSGHAYYDNRDNNGAALLDQSATFPAQGEVETGQQAFNLDGSEIAFSSNVDAYFSVWLAATMEDGGMEVEEAWLQTRALPYGLQAKAGRFLSRIGYLNTKHNHDWDFIDQNLAYTSLFHGEHLSGDGVQLTWLAPTDSYWLFGVEAIQGDGLNGFGQSQDADALVDALGVADTDGLGLKQHKGPNLFTGFIHFSPDLGTRQALQLGLSAAWHQDQSNTFATGSNDALLTQGGANLVGMQAVYKSFASDSYGTHGLTLSAEVFSASADNRGSIFSAGAITAAATAKLRENAGYVQAVYGFAPRWQVGLRHAAAGFGSKQEVAGVDAEVHTSRQDSALLSWKLSEFSRLRLEVSHNRVWPQDGNAGAEQFNQAMLGYTMIIGAHPAHHF